MKESKLIMLALKSEIEALRLSQKLTSEDDEVIIVNTKHEINYSLKTRSFDLLVIDIEINETDAMDICKEIRGNENIEQPYIIVLSNKTEDYIQSLVLDGGADDFITKPLKTPLFIARIKALFSRKIMLKSKKEIVQAEKFYVDEEKHLVFINSKTIDDLPKKEFNVLALLYSQPNKVFSREEIISKVGKKDADYHSVDIYIYNIRRLIGEDIVETIKGFGYRLSPVLV
jgi:two-component system, OmpR family, alkaline phosphatase synthesis response regulator PhoP